MEIKVIEETKTSLVADLPGLDHTFCNNLKKELYEDPAVKEASYVVSHPLVGTPTFLVHTEKKAPKQALKDAVTRINAKNKQFLADFKKL